MRVGVQQKFLEKLILVWWRHYCDVTANFSKNDVSFAMTSQAIQILHAQISDSDLGKLKKLGNFPLP